MSKKKRNDQIPTPEQYVNRMLDAIGYKDHVVGKRILENSCGEGNILQAIVKRYIEDAKRTGLTQTEIKKGLECDIIAYEKDRRLVRRCRRNLNKVCREFQINDINWNIKKTDYLKNSRNEKKVDFVIGNPPYVTYHDISVEERKFLKEKYEEVLAMTRLGQMLYDDGVKKGMERGMEKKDNQLTELTARLLEENRLDDLKRSTEDKEFKEQLLKEFGIE